MTRRLRIAATAAALALALLAGAGVAVARAASGALADPERVALKLTRLYLERDWEAYWPLAAPGSGRDAWATSARLDRDRDRAWQVTPETVLAVALVDTAGAGRGMRTVRVLATTTRGRDLVVWTLVDEAGRWRVIERERNPGGSPDP